MIAYRVIFARAERGVGLDLFLRMQRDAHEALQPTRDEAKNDDVEPIRPVFVRRSEPATAVGTAPASQESPPASPLTVDGREYE